MVEISNLGEKCFARTYDGCVVLSVIQPQCSPKCPFYKPIGCTDWVRVDTRNQIFLIPPEEYERKYRNEQDKSKQNAVYWRIKNVSVSKERLR